MKITIYELLGLIKDGKAPKKIKVYDEIFEYQDTYIDEDRLELFHDYYIKLNDELEIIEAEQDIEKAKILLFEETGEAITYPRSEEYNEQNFKELKRVTDELIKAVNELKNGSRKNI